MMLIIVCGNALGYLYENILIYLIEKCFHLAIASTIAYKSALCDVFLEPALQAYSMFDMKHTNEIFNIGYKAAMQQKELFLS